jgi:hypothetical protein
MVDGEDSGRFKQVVPSDEEFVPGSVEGSVEGDDDSERANDDAESSDDKDLGEKRRDRGVDQAESRAGDVGVSPSFLARLRPPVDMGRRTRVFPRSDLLNVQPPRSGKYEHLLPHIAQTPTLGRR